MASPVYPLPAFVTVIAFTDPEEMVAVAVAVVPLVGADIVTVGADEYPEPPVLISTLAIVPLSADFLVPFALKKWSYRISGSSFFVK